MVNGEHLNQKGLEKVVSNKAVMHGKPSSRLTAAFPNLVFLKTPDVAISAKDNDSFLDPNWISGFIEGDGSFYITLNSKSRYVYLRMAIHLHIREEFLLIKIQQYFGGLGSIYTHKGNNSVELKVFKRSDLISIWVSSRDPDPYLLMGFGGRGPPIWKEIFYLVEEKAHLTPDGLTKIQILKDQLNKWAGYG